MKRKLMVICLLLAVLALPLTGCITDDSKTTVSPFTQQIADLQAANKTFNTDIAKLKEDMAKKVELSTVTDLIKTFTAGAAGSGTSGYSKAETYTRAEVDGKIADLQKTVNDLSARLSTFQPGANGGVPTSNTGQVTVSLNPSPSPLWSSPYTAGNSGFTQFTMHITNNSSVPQYAKPHITLSNNSQLMVRKVNVSMNGDGYNMYMQADMVTAGNAASTVYTANLNGNSAPSPLQIFSLQPWGTTSSSLSIEPAFGFSNNAGEMYILPGQSKDIQVSLGTLLTDLNTGQYTISVIIIPHP